MLGNYSWAALQCSGYTQWHSMWEKTFAFLSSCHLQIGVGLVSPSLVVLRLCLAWTCADLVRAVTVSVFMFTSLVSRRRCFLGVMDLFWILESVCFFCTELWALREGFHTDILFRDECTCSVVDLFVNYYLWQEESSPMKVEWCSGLWVEQCHWESFFCYVPLAE